MNKIFQKLAITFIFLLHFTSFASEDSAIYSKRAITVYCNNTSEVLKKVAGNYIESWIDTDKNQWFNYTDVNGKIAILIKPADRSDSLCFVSLGKVQNLKFDNNQELPK